MLPQPLTSKKMSAAFNKFGALFPVTLQAAHTYFIHGLNQYVATFSARNDSYI
jgi:hypothetical protein